MGLAVESTYGSDEVQRARPFFQLLAPPPAVLVLAFYVTHAVATQNFDRVLRRVRAASIASLLHCLEDRVDWLEAIMEAGA